MNLILDQQGFFLEQGGKEYRVTERAGTALLKVRSAIESGAKESNYVFSCINQGSKWVEKAVATLSRDYPELGRAMMELSHEFLHSHDMLLPHAGEEHVLVDRKDWAEARHMIKEIKKLLEVIK